MAFGNDGTGDYDLLDDEGSAADAAIPGGDFDADGDLDLAAVPYYGVYDLDFYTNNGSGNFRLSTSLTWGVGATTALTADVDGDGALDVVVSGSGLSVLLNTP